MRGIRGTREQRRETERYDRDVYFVNLEVLSKMRHNFKKLEVWNRSLELVKNVYLATRKLPSEERFGLISQINRSAISIPSNIAEGSGRGTNKQFVQFLNYSIGSLCELETQMILIKDLGLDSNIEVKVHLREINELRKMIIGFKKSLIPNP